jgi:hypothetical protein
MKNAIEFYKNIQNNKFHNFYSGIINARLYTGKCVVVSQNILNTFNNKNKTSSDELCNLTIQVINILDSVFEICPRLQIRKIAEITSYNFYILLKDTIRSLVINYKYFFSFLFFIYI